MKTVILVSIDFDDLPIPFKIASENEPNKSQILEKIIDIVNQYGLSKEVKFKSFHQENGQKLYFYQIGDADCYVFVERIEIWELSM